MKRLSAKTLLVAALSVAAIGTYGEAQILKVDLSQMVASTDGAVYGTIISKETIRIDHPIDGPELYFTTLTIDGRDLATNAPKKVSVSFPGGFIDAEHGAYNSEAPAEKVVAVGKQVVAFHKWSDNMGGDFASNALFASHGGVYSTFESKGEVIVQGRGDGYAVPRNVRLDRLQESVQFLSSQQR
ncbi:MAG: hypothetical protein KDB61_04045 [Planctomycetes bacterium]|nr:hypothetical protein [Planctomycetota bacterium]